MGEPGVDEGGLKREFWRLLGYDIRAKMCAGDDDRLSFDHNIIYLQVCTQKFDQNIFGCVH